MQFAILFAFPRYHIWQDQFTGVLLAITIPAVYDKYQEDIDQKLSMALDVVLKQYESILNGGQGGSTKEKKTQ